MYVLKCVICGKDFKVTPNRKNKAKCCSMKCRNEMIQLINKKKPFTKENIKYIRDICVLKDTIYNGYKVYMNGNYPAIYLDGKNHHLHRYVWEQANGPIPKNMVIHHKDFNRGNWSLDNLEMLTRAEHIKCHKINRWNSADMITSVLERSNNANI